MQRAGLRRSNARPPEDADLTEELDTLAEIVARALRSLDPTGEQLPLIHRINAALDDLRELPPQP